MSEEKKEVERKRVSTKKRPIRAKRTALRNCMENGMWRCKTIVGKKKSARTPCIRVRHYKWQFDGSVYAYQGAWILRKNPVPKGKIITHDCAMPAQRKSTAKRKRRKKSKINISSCINPRHMRLSDVKRNRSQSKCHQKLAEYKQKWQSRKEFDGPFFVEDMSGDEVCEHGDENGNGLCFLNSGTIEDVNGIFWGYN